uniref:Uncharacterized protein n=1 Tax=Arundo donax TaxID=35708 RepID=A0A0A9BR16_ARUDO
MKDRPNRCCSRPNRASRV